MWGRGPVLVSLALLAPTLACAQSQLPPIVIQSPAPRRKQSAPAAAVPPAASDGAIAQGAAEETAAQADLEARLKETDLIGTAVAGSQGAIPREVLLSRPA